MTALSTHHDGLPAELTDALDRQRALVLRLYDESNATVVRHREAERVAHVYAEMLLERRTNAVHVTASEWEALAAYAAQVAETDRQAKEARRLLDAAWCRQAELEEQVRLERDALSVGGI